MKRLGARLAWSVAIALGVSFVTFVLAFVVPADPARTMAGPKADRATVERIRRELGLDAPVVVQYVRYLARIARGDLGTSYMTRENVLQSILERLPATATLALVALSFSVACGLGVGLWTAANAGAATDLLVLAAALVVLSIPVFWLGLLLLYVFGYKLRWLPLGGFGSPAHVVLPATTLGLGGGAYYARLVHANLRDALQSDYIRTAWAKGLGPRSVYAKHALRNALLPLTTLVGLDLAGLMSGVVLTETVFSWPGLGRLAVEAVFNQDIPMILGTVLFSTVLVIVANLLVDALYLWIDPRTRRGGHI